VTLLVFFVQLFEFSLRGPLAEEGYNLNISRYISTAVGEDEIDLSATQGELVEIQEQIRDATSRHNAFLKELSLSLLPGEE
jgi:type I restriction enzyme M protein